MHLRECAVFIILRPRLGELIAGLDHRRLELFGRAAASVHDFSYLISVSTESNVLIVVLLKCSLERLDLLDVVMRRFGRLANVFSRADLGRIFQRCLSGVVRA